MSQQTARAQRPVGGLVGAMLVLLVLILGWVGLRNLTSNDPDSPVQNLDYARDVPLARKTAGFDLVAPPSLPNGWRATSVRFTPAPGAHWHLGVLNRQDRYVGLEQGEASVASMVDTYVDEAAERGAPAQVAGRTWLTFSDAGGDLALVRRAGGTTTLVVGHDVSRSDLVSYTASLR